jgi:hypothetical protein
MPKEIRKGQYTTDAPLPRSAPPPVPYAPEITERVAKLYQEAPELLALRSAFPSRNTLMIDDISVAIVDYTPAEGRREWYAYVYTEPAVNVQPFFSRTMLLWWLRSEDGRAAVHEAYRAGAGMN